MLVLGIESTAHTFAAGIVDANDGPVVLANVRAMHRPTVGGIHPRAAADHHAQHAPHVIQSALSEARIRVRDLDAVAFARSPGLGPCLRVGATLARGIAAHARVPLVPVNHCVAHVEIGRALGAEDNPLVLYASGGNTQIIHFLGQHYRVLGETLDIGVGNLLDKVARQWGHAFPGGPAIEALAKKGRPTIELPYSIQGMDITLSGLQTAALARGAEHAHEDVAASMQETAFGMLIETLERAFHVTGAEGIALAGGVACNRRLQQMALAMGGDVSASVTIPPPDLLVDNGAMVAWTGSLAMSHVGPTPPDSRIHQGQRTDEVPIPWRSTLEWRARETPWRGAESTVTRGTFLGFPTVTKHRPPKSYRDPYLDRRLRHSRTRAEARAIHAARRAGVAAPAVLDYDEAHASLTVQHLPGEPVRDIEHVPARAMAALGESVRRLHDARIAHGDLTQANAIWDGQTAWLIDLGLACQDAEERALATDLHVLQQDLRAQRTNGTALWNAFIGGYGRDPAREQAVATIQAQGRYRGS